VAIGEYPHGHGHARRVVISPRSHGSAIHRAVGRQRAIDPAILQAAIAGLEAQRTRLDDQINAVRSMLNGASRSPKPRRRYRISKEGRARIAAAARKRWAAIKKAARAKKAA
jgi:hypothetical protein